MEFRTPVQLPVDAMEINHGHRIMMLGSCFTGNIGSRMLRDGFNACVNPMGALYNPVSIARVITRALDRQPFTRHDLVERDAIFHCLAFESSRQHRDADILLRDLNDDFTAFADSLAKADVWIITFGTAWIFTHNNSGQPVGNCHKLRADEFTRTRLSVKDITDLWRPLSEKAPRIIFTVSPIRHTADGMHGNMLSKAVLHLAIDELGAEYFPAFEIVNDELRDYRFYAADMKHPSEVAVDYIYEQFGKTYFTTQTLERAREERRRAARLNHRPILVSNG